MALTTNPVFLTPSHVVPAVSTQVSTFPATPRRVYTFPTADERNHADPSLTTRVNTFPTIDTRVHANSTLTSEDHTLPPIATRGYGSPTLPAQFLPSQTVTSQPHSVPSWSVPFVASTYVYTRPIVSVRVPASSSTDAIPVTAYEIRGPVIAPQNRHGLRRYADTAQVMNDTLESMDSLGEMNTDNLEKMILRLPKWAQTKFREYLKNL